MAGAKTNERNVNEYNAIFDQIDKEFIESQKPIIIDSNEYKYFKSMTLELKGDFIFQKGSFADKRNYGF